LEEIEKAYLAGIVDGEGTITLTRHHKSELPGPNVTIANNDLKLLQWVKERAGGTIVSKKKRRPHHDNSYVWGIKQDRAIRFLEIIIKYLIVKKPQAELIVKEYKAATYRAGKYSPEMLAKKMALVEKIRKLNQR